MKVWNEEEENCMKRSIIEEIIYYDNEMIMY